MYQWVPRMLVFADEGDPEDSGVAPKVRRALLAKLLAPIELVLGDGKRCCANQMLITESVTAQPKTCDPWLQNLVDIGSWAASENLFTQWQDLCISVHDSSRTVSCVSLRTLYLVRTHAACLIVHGNIGECVVTSKDAILSLMTAKYVRARPRTVETGLSAAPLL